MGILRIAQLTFFIGFCLSLFADLILCTTGDGSYTSEDFSCDILVVACSIGCTITTLALR